MSYAGGKAGAGVYQTIINLMPPHDTYIEPFVGGGAILKAKRPARLNIAIDKSTAVIAEHVEARRAGAWKPLTANHRTRSVIGMGDGDTAYRFQVGDAIEWLRKYNFTGQELVYCDPPYLMSTRSSQRPIYEFELATEEQHVELLVVLKKLRCMVMLSGYPSELYEQHLGLWPRHDFKAMTRGGHQADERVWFNFEPPNALHDYRYLGETFRQRERIKRKAERWVANLEKMPGLERLAILSRIAERM